MKILTYSKKGEANTERNVDSIVLTDFCYVRDGSSPEKIPFYEGKDLHLYEAPICSYCLTTPTTRLLCCSRCHIAWYCDSRCQKAHYKMEHKSLCNDVAKDLKRVEDEARPLHNTPFGEDPEPQNIFETQVGYFGLVPETHSYLNARRYLVETYIHASFSTEIKDVWEKALFHALGLLRLDMNDPFDIQMIIPFILLHLNRDDDTYDFVCFWLKANTFDQESLEKILCRSQEGEWIYPRETSSRFDDVFEHNPALNDPDVHLAFLVAFLFLKVRLIATYDATCKSVDFALHETAHGPRILEVRDAVKDMLTGNMYGDIAIQRQQVERLADLIHRINPSMLPSYLNVRRILNQKRPRTQIRGDPSEIYDILNYSNSCFLRIPGAQNMLEERFGENPTFNAQIQYT